MNKNNRKDRNLEGIWNQGIKTSAIDGLVYSAPMGKAIFCCDFSERK
jgi:hypothetical protein